MSAKKPKSTHAKAIAAFISGRISADEYRMCWRGEAWVTRSGIYLPLEFCWKFHSFNGETR